MTKSIKLAPPTLLGRTNLSKRSSSAKAKARTILNADQVRAVMDPWILSFTKMVLDSDIPSENDGISDEMREWLLRPKNRWNPTIWAKAFVDYVRSIKPLEEALQYRETGEYDCQLEMSDPLDSPGYISSLFERTAEAPTTDEDLTSPIVLERLTRRLSVATPLQAVALYYKSKRSGEKELFTSLTRAAYAVFAPSFKKQKKQAILARKRKAEA